MKDKGRIERFGMHGFYKAQLYLHRTIIKALEGKDPDELKWAVAGLSPLGGLLGFERVREVCSDNAVVNEYRNHVLDCGLGGGTVHTNLRMGLFSNDVTPGRTLTLATMSGTLTEFTAYSVESGNTTNRAPYTAAAAASQSVSNTASPSRFTFTGTGTIRGTMIICGATLKSGASDATPPNILASAGRLDADLTIPAAGSIVDMTYTQSNDT